LSTAVYTIGHSTRSLPELLALLREHGIQTLADVRTGPRSRRVPQFNQDALATVLPAEGVTYVHLSRLGGWRHGLGEQSPNTYWRNESFRAYADYTQTAEFAAGLNELIALAEAALTVIMCAEALPWRCHRWLISDALAARGLSVCHITGPGQCRPHALTPAARLADGYLVYLAEEKEYRTEGKE
jgi:uncharacterized protein (DUF488 family)